MPPILDIVRIAVGKGPRKINATTQVGNGPEDPTRELVLAVIAIMALWVLAGLSVIFRFGE